MVGDEPDFHLLNNQGHACRPNLSNKLRMLFLFSQLFPFDYELLCCCINITAWHDSFFFFLACLWRIYYVNTFKGKILLFTIKIPIVTYIFQSNITIGKKAAYVLFI